MKNCPYCAEEIQDAAVVCRYCGRNLISLLFRARVAYVRVMQTEATFHLALFLVLLKALAAGYTRAESWWLAGATVILTVVTWFWSVAGPFNDDWHAGRRYVRMSLDIADVDEVKMMIDGAVRSRRIWLTEGVVIGLLGFWSLGLPTTLALPFAWVYCAFRTKLLDARFATWIISEREYLRVQGTLPSA